ncbi:MAG: PTS sugar transporter subunit IIA [Aeromonadales bacterium]|nr:PTS sugar transporter subunit IIA [Aeromonadales bacterium]MDY2891903.1 PTS sugar transporter subunit IIA [Succinivibrio sp.]
MKILSESLVLSPLFCFSRKRLFEEIADCASAVLKADSSTLIRALNAREEYGTTVFYSGIALPHAAVPGISRTLGIMSILDAPVSFSSIDADPQSIDIAYTLFVGEDEDCDAVSQLLQNITGVFSNQDLLNSLRLARNEDWKIRKLLGQAEAMLDSMASRAGEGAEE